MSFYKGLSQNMPSKETVRGEKSLWPAHTDEKGATGMHEMNVKGLVFFKKIASVVKHTGGSECCKGSSLIKAVYNFICSLFLEIISR